MTEPLTAASLSARMTGKVAELLNQVAEAKP